MDTTSTPILSMRQQICDALRGEIMAGEISSNQPVREQNLAKRFGVSRNSVRDALLQLSQEGGLIYSPNCGVRVSSPPTNVESRLYARLRREIEMHSLEIALSSWTKEDDANLNRLQRTLIVACEQQDLKAITETDLAMHRYWVSKASKQLESVWLGITVRMLIAYSQLDNYMQCCLEHAAIVEAIACRDLSAAKKAVELNIRSK
jgi:DNA-binding GntR family transcriptional regulator